MNRRGYPRPGRGRPIAFGTVCLVLLSLGPISAGPLPPLAPTPAGQPLTSPGAAPLASPPAATSAPAIDAYHLVTPTLGWLLLDNHLYQTQTGGQTWNDLTPPNLAEYQIRAATFLEEQSGWLVLTDAPAEGKLNYALARTRDGGRSWQQRSLPLFAPSEVAALASAVYLQFLDAQTGWLVVKQATSSNFSLGSLFRTRDGGDTWTRLPLPVGEPVRFETATAGWTAGGAAGTDLYRTLDGGQTWLPFAPTGLDSPSPRFELPVFANEREGILPLVVSVGNETQVEFLRTLDGGANWQKSAQTAGQPSPSAPLVSVIDDQHWVVMEPQSQKLTRFSAQAVTGITPRLPVPARLASLDMVSPDVGWALSMVSQCVREPDQVSGATVQTFGQCKQLIQLLRTENGGQDWSALPLPPAGASTLSSSGSFSIQAKPVAPGGLAIQALGGRTQLLTGQGFDKCTIPNLAALQDWTANSPYKAVNLYIGGSLRGCANTALTASYLTQLTQLGWTFIPTWVGPQVACSPFSSKISDDPTANYAQASAQGIAEADAAVNAAVNLGLTLADKSGTVIYYDLEAYAISDPKCSASREAAKVFVSSWTQRLRALGNQAGVYGGAYGSALGDFAGIANVPDAVWLAAWYRVPPDTYHSDATVWLGPNSYFADSLWVNHQRIRQYGGDHDETWGATTMAIDSDVIDGPVATLADHTPPTVRTQIYLLYPNSPFRDFHVLFNGTDDISGIASYDLQYQVDGQGDWHDAITNTVQTDYHFIGDYGHTYTFRARARDRAGNLSAYPSVGDSSHTVPAYCPANKDSFESDDTPSTASPLQIGAVPQTHNFHVQSDQDWVTMTLQANTPYMIATGNVGGFADTVITLYAPDGVTYLAENDDDPGNWPASRLVWKPVVSGTYYLRVKHFDIYGYGCSTTYTLSAVQAFQYFLPVIGGP